MTDLRLVLAGAPTRNDNRGVEALGRSVLDAIDEYGAETAVTVLDGGWGVTPHPASSRGARMTVEFAGVRRSRRWHRAESWTQIRLAQHIRPRWNPVAKRFADADAVLDLSGGDSFTDLYGRARLDTVAAPKYAAIRAHRPLVLLPQTYGPFATDEGRRLAQTLVRSATVAYARDDHSFESLLELVGAEADTSRLRNGVDVAFALEPVRPPDEVVGQLAAINGEVVAGVNVSGLLQKTAHADRFGLTGDYIRTVTDIVRQLVRAGAVVVLVAHVYGQGWGENDLAAISSVRESLTDGERNRTMVLAPALRAAEVKWCISRFDWLMGSRMHATIAGLSTQVPTFGYAYSDKTRGVFETCDMGDQVADARTVTGREAIDLAMHSFEGRDNTKASLALVAPGLVARARNQVLDVLDEVRGWAQESARIEAIVR